MQNGVQFNIRVSEELMKALEEHSAETGVPKAKIARKGLEMVLEQGYPRGNPRQAAREALGIASESPPEEKDSRTEADAPKSPDNPYWFWCPVKECGFRAKSKAAICPTHGRRVQ